MESTSKSRAFPQPPGATVPYSPTENIFPIFEHFVVVGVPADSPQLRNLPRHKVYDLRATPELLYVFPDTDLDALSEIPAFCFPSGVKLSVVEKNADSLYQEFNEVAFGRSHVPRADAFLFTLTDDQGKKSIGVCVTVKALVGVELPGERPGRFYLCAHKCYCFISRHPFIQLHFEVLSSLLAQDRLNRLRLLATNPKAQVVFTSSPLQRVLSLRPIIPFELPPEPDKDALKRFLRRPFRKDAPSLWGGHSIFSRYRHNTPASGPHRSASTDEGLSDNVAGNSRQQRSRPRALTPVATSHKITAEAFRPLTPLANGYNSSRSSPAEERRPLISYPSPGKCPITDILREYRSCPIPAPGSQFAFRMSQDLQPIEFRRPPTDDDAELLKRWCLPVSFACLPLENILRLLSACLLERHVVVVCANLSVLSSIVLSIVPLLRPYQWQCLLCPVLPLTMLDFLDAPVPFVVGVPEFAPELVPKLEEIVFLHVDRKQVHVPTSDWNLPTLPRLRELSDELRPLSEQLFLAGPARVTMFDPDPVKDAVLEKILYVLQQYYNSWELDDVSLDPEAAASHLTTLPSQQSSPESSPDPSCPPLSKRPGQVLPTTPSAYVAQELFLDEVGDPQSIFSRGHTVPPVSLDELLPLSSLYSANTKAHTGNKAEPASPVTGMTSHAGPSSSAQAQSREPLGLSSSVSTSPSLPPPPTPSDPPTQTQTWNGAAGPMRMVAASVSGHGPPWAVPSPAPRTERIPSDRTSSFSSEMSELYSRDDDRDRPPSAFAPATDDDDQRDHRRPLPSSSSWRSQNAAVASPMPVSPNAPQGDVNDSLVSANATLQAQTFTSHDRLASLRRSRDVKQGFPPSGRDVMPVNPDDISSSQQPWQGSERNVTLPSTMAVTRTPQLAARRSALACFQKPLDVFDKEFVELFRRTQLYESYVQRLDEAAPT